MYVLAFAGATWRAPINPESLDVTYPTRATTTPTMRSHYIDMFGADLGRLVVAGTTGWGKSKRANHNGIASMKQLIALHRAYTERAASAADPDTVRILFADGYTGAAFSCTTDRSGLNVQQNKQSPLIQKYTYTLTILQVLSGGQASGGASAASGLPGGEGSTGAASTLGDSAWGKESFPYTMQPGDTIARVASMFGISVRELSDANTIRAASRVAAGTVIMVPQ